MSDFLVARKGFIEEVEQVVVQRHNLLHELHVLHQAHQIIGEQLHGRNRPDTAGVKRRRMYVATLHQAEHLARHAAHLQSLTIKSPGEGVQRGHDVGDGAIAVKIGVRRVGLLRLRPDARVGFLDHLLAEVHAHQVVLKDVVIEHVLRSFAQIDNPFAQVRRANAEGHVLRVIGAGRVIVAADAADTAGDEVRVPRILALHEDAVAAEDRRSAVALRNLAVGEIDFGENAQASDNSGNRIPIHLHELPLLIDGFFIG